MNEDVITCNACSRGTLWHKIEIAITKTVGKHTIHICIECSRLGRDYCSNCQGVHAPTFNCLEYQFLLKDVTYAG